MRTYFSFALLFLFLSCGSDEQAPKNEEVLVASTSASSKQLNINILWDLSDRIDPTLNPATPEHYQRDIEIIKDIAEVFKQDMNNKGVYMAKGKMKVFFTPPPSDKNINAIANNLSKDLSKYSGEGASKEKKKIYDNIIKDFVDNSHKIYASTIANNKGKTDWEGSDIWRFFKKDTDKIIDPDPNYRNILVILSDGYIYHKDSKGKAGNRTQYILPETLKPFRNNPNWENLFNDKDFGLMNASTNLSNLEVLVLEVTPSKGNKNDEEYISAYLEKWFKEMGIKKFKIYSTDIPSYTKNRINAFINSN